MSARAHALARPAVYTDPQSAVLDDEDLCSHVLSVLNPEEHVRVKLVSRAFHAAARHHLRKKAGQLALERSRVTMLAIGGTVNLKAQHSVEVFDGQAWRAGPPMSQVCGGLSAAAALDGKVYVMGDGAPLRVPRVEVLEPSVGEWRAGPALNMSRWYSTAVALGGSMYCMGGYSAALAKCLRTVEVLKPNGAWQYGPPMITARAHHAAVACSGKLFAIGGSLDVYVGGALASVEVLEPSGIASVWQQGPPLTTPRSGACAAVLGGKIYVMGGRSALGAPLNSVEVLDLTDGVWRPAPAMRVPRAFAAAATVVNRLYVIAGGAGNTGVTESCNSVEYFDVVTNQWHSAASLESARSFLRAVAL